MHCVRIEGIVLALKSNQFCHLPIIAAHNVVNRYKPIVLPTNFPALPKLNISITEIAIDTKTRGSTMHFNARMNRSPTRPIHRMAVDLLTGSSGCQNDNPIPMPIPFNIAEQYGKLYLKKKVYQTNKIYATHILCAILFLAYISCAHTAMLNTEYRLTN